MDRDKRIERLLTGIANAVHANQILLAQKAEGDFPAFQSDLDEEHLQSAVDNLDQLLNGHIASLLKWVNSGEGLNDDIAAIDRLAAIDLTFDSGLPYCLSREWAEKHIDNALKAQAFAVLMQTAFEVNRDGTLLQNLFRLYNGLELLCSPEDLGLADDNDVYLGEAEQLAPETAAAPFDVDIPAWQIQFRKLQNWSIKHRAQHPADAMARELLEDGRVAETIPFIKALPPERIAVLGHSFSMWLNWSSHDMFANITREFIRMHNPGPLFTWFGEGGMTALRARKNHFDNVIAWRPARIILVCVIVTDEDYAAVKEMGEVCKTEGIRLTVFDGLYPGASSIRDPEIEKLVKLAEQYPIDIVKTKQAIADHPEVDSFVSLDGIHCRENYHMLMAGELIRFLSGIEQ